MNAHFSEELPRLLTGEASRDVVLDVAAHLRTCVDCQQELVSAVVAHASLSSAQRFAPEVVRAPPERPTAEPADPLPDLSAVFAQVREEVDSDPRLIRPRSLRTRYLVGAAAAAIVVGGSALAVVTLTDSSTPATRTVALAAYDEGTTSARATLSGTQMRIDASSLPVLSGKGYEVWLTDDARTDMKPIGWIGSDGTATITVPQELISKYSDIEVSVQDVTVASYEYSNVSVLRGDYT